MVFFINHGQVLFPNSSEYLGFETFHDFITAMKELKLTVVAVNDYVTTDEGTIIPSEISVVKSSLVNGVQSTQYHAIVDCEFGEWGAEHSVPCYC